MTIKLRNKTPRVWIDRTRTTNLRHQTSDPNAALSFSCCLFLLVSLGIVMWLPFGKVNFAYYLNSSSFFYLLSMGAVQPCANSGLSNLISEWLNRNANQKNFEALIRCVSNLSPNSHVTIDTIHPIVCRTQSNCFEYATLQSAIHENSLEYPGVIDTKSDEMNKN